MLSIAAGVTGRHLVEALTFIFLTAVIATMATPSLATLTVHQMGTRIEALKLKVS